MAQNKSITIFFGAILFLITLLLQGCSINKLAVRTVGDIIVNGEAVFEEEGDLEIAKAALPANLKLLEVLYREDPSNKRLGVMLAKSYFAYSFAFVEEEYWDVKYANYEEGITLKKRAGKFYLKGKDYALKVLAEKQSFVQSLSGDLMTLEKNLQLLEQSDLPGLFWLGFNWGQFINLNMDSMEALSNVIRVKLIMERVIELDSNYYYGAAHIFLGSYYSSRPTMLGGNPKLGKKHYEDAIAISRGEFLITKVFYARYFATQFQDITLYNRLLLEVKDAPESILKGQEFLTAVSKKIADRLIRQKEEFFDLDEEQIKKVK